MTERIFHSVAIRGLDSNLSRHGGGFAVIFLSVGRIGLDHVIQTEDRKRDPDRSRRAGAHFENGEAGNAGGEHDLEIDHVVRRELDLFVGLLEEVDNDLCGMGVFREIFSFLLDLARERINLVIRRLIMTAGMLLQAAMKFIVPLSVIVQNDAAGGRLTVTCSIPGIAVKVCLICSSSSRLPFADATFIRMRPGIWCAICSFILVIADLVFLLNSDIFRKPGGATSNLVFRTSGGSS